LGRAAGNASMISKYRNRSLWYLSGALVLTILLVVMLYKVIRLSTFRDDIDVAVLFLTVYFGAWLLWVLTSLDLARAKGCSRPEAARLLMIFLIVGFVLPVALLVFPFYVVFALKDKTKNRTRSVGSPLKK